MRFATSGRSLKTSFEGLPLPAPRSLTNVDGYALMNIPPAVARNWLSRAKIRLAPVDDGVVADEQKTIDLYFRSGLIKKQLSAADIVDRSFAGAIGKARAFSRAAFRENPSKSKKRASVPIQSEWRGQSSHSFSPDAFCEKGVISKLTTKKFCEIAVRLLSPSYCPQLKRFFRSGGRARIVAAVS